MWKIEGLGGGYLDQTIRAECQKLGFENLFLTFDAFAAHLTDDVESQLLEAKTDTLTIPAGCTSKCQLMDVCLNKPFKAILRKCWVNYISSVVETFPDASQDPSFKIPTPTRQQMVDWVKEAFDYLTRNQEMVKHSFEVCGITVSDTEKVRNADFYKRCMKDVLESLGNEVEEDDDDTFTL